ncbi:hypothetical protein BV22DRAFT_1108257 [Leucogyrophana mollusca]|uniref:Uncharacterized protein n=1 Tax=Leucogyrophana mollusca TaxID=85980 RepID=A0ACB8AZZ8_9AGAM|nr:hypothetical protein BV22DRAFT_1108257 [Leucogyrophana mollusca]
MPEENARSDSDLESHADQDSNAQGPSKPGRKKNPNSQAARRDQNRIAQREFRLRKQQRIRDLEARVELLSGSQDEALTDLRAVLKDLMTENQTLRNLLKSVAGFIGDGLGGMVPKMGWNMTEFNDFVNKSETDTAWESFQARRQAQKTTQSSNAMSSVLGPQSAKRVAEENSAGPSRKKQRSMEADGDRQDYSLVMPISSTVPPVPQASVYSSSNGRSSHNNIFSDLMRGPDGAAMFMPPTPSGTPSHYPAPSPSSYHSSYMQSMGMSVEPGLSPIPYSQNKNGAVMSQQRIPPQQNHLPHDEIDDDSDLDPQQPKKIEAFKLIRYHLDNFMRNSAYCLPSSLRPTLVQSLAESAIDRMLHPDLRDRIILLRGQFSLADCMIDYKKAVTIHGDDVLAHSNWEIAEWWLRKYAYLVEKETLDHCNRWRRERGESELKLADIGARTDHVSST